jgi:hypothetical protein
MESRYPTMVAVFELLMKICTKAVSDTWAIDQPVKSVKITTQEVELKKVI